jgi:5'-nucleotidase
MSGPKAFGRRSLLAVAATALAVGAVVAGPTASVSAVPDRGDVAKARFFSFNDFHGALDAPSGSGAAVNGVPAGGAEYLATTLEKLRADADSKGQKALTAGAGDMVGATPLLSAAFHDEPSIETLNLLQMDVTSVGNHEFDEGVAELLRLQNGGCHPVDGCQDGDPYFGADFPYLAANTVYKDTGEPILPAWTVRKVQGVSVGFIGMTLEGTPSIVNPAGITSVNFLDEIEQVRR